LTGIRENILGGLFFIMTSSSNEYCHGRGMMVIKLFIEFQKTIDWMDKK